jgi:hypothetical protein
LDFAFVPEFLAATSLLEPAEVCRTELKPFLTILGTRMRAKPCERLEISTARAHLRSLISGHHFKHNNVAVVGFHVIRRER